MLIIRITGGIGNQLFQYAFVRSLSLKLNQKFKLDLSWYRDYHKFEKTNDSNAATQREYLLDKFKIKENLLSPAYLSISYRLNNSSIFKKMLKYQPFNYFSYSTINELDFDINKINSFNNVYLSGFWQKTNLFEEISDLIIEEFALKNNLSEKNKILLEKISSTNSIAVHIRRGDLLDRPVAVADQPSSSHNYYYNAINIISEKIKDPELFIFSDDIIGIKDNYQFDIPTTYIDNNGPDYEHFNLMSGCKHQIIANSTFSWWAAWLNKNEKKIVISPKWWYRDPVKNKNIIRIPQNWIVLENIEN
ncbi:MAG: alpha-1,2-fucosyltransferase [Candidatus Neomarinimicrobiota bacterium]